MANSVQLRFAVRRRRCYGFILFRPPLCACTHSSLSVRPSAPCRALSSNGTFSERDSWLCAYLLLPYVDTLHVCLLLNQPLRDVSVFLPEETHCNMQSFRLVFTSSSTSSSSDGYIQTHTPRNCAQLILNLVEDNSLCNSAILHAHYSFTRHRLGPISRYIGKFSLVL